MKLRDLPSVDELVARRRTTRSRSPRRGRVLDRAREEIRAGADPGDLRERLAEALAAARRPALRRVLNATGVLVHTNLGRAPLAEAALERVREAAGYSNLEYDLSTRLARLAPGPPRAAAAAADRSRGGDRRQQQRRGAPARARRARRGPRGRRLARRADRDRRRLPHPGRARPLGRPPRRGRDDEPDARRRLRARDRAGDGAAAARAPVELPRRRLHRAAARSRSSRRSRAATSCRSSTTSARARSSRSRASRPRPPRSPPGADLVCFSGDKLLGGPQAGIVAGRADLVERLRRHPLHRALRSDKLTLAALEGTLALYLDRPDEIPVLRMLREPAEAVRARAERLAEATGGAVEETVARVGGGALPLAELPSFACAVEEELAAALRAARAAGDRGRPRRPHAARLPHAHRRRGGRGRGGGSRMPLTVGTAGHIDHGKTWLVRALTGKDTDRLPEERERGISIDLGYAPLDLPDGRRLSLIDVPGPRALRPQHGRRRDRDRPLPARRRRRRGRAAADARAPRDPLAARDRARRRRGHEGGCGRRRDARARASRRRASSSREPRSVAVSAKTGAGLDELARRAGARRGPCVSGTQSRPRAGAPLRRPRLLAARDRHGRDRDALVGIDRRGRRAARRARRTRRPRPQRPGARPPGRAGRGRASASPSRSRASSGSELRRGDALSRRALPVELPARRRARGARADRGRRAPARPPRHRGRAGAGRAGGGAASRSSGSRRPSSPRAATASSSAARRPSAAAPCIDPAPRRHADRERFERAARGEKTVHAPVLVDGAWHVLGGLARGAARRARTGDRRSRPARPGRDAPVEPWARDVLARLPFERSGSKLYRPGAAPSLGEREAEAAALEAELEAAAPAPVKVDGRRARALPGAERHGSSASATATPSPRRPTSGRGRSSSRSARAPAGSRSPASATSPAAAAATRSSCSSVSTRTASRAGSATSEFSGVRRHGQREHVRPV